MWFATCESSVSNKINEIIDYDKLNLIYTYALIDRQRKDNTYLARISMNEIASILFPNKTDKQIEYAIKNNVITYIKKLCDYNLIKVDSKELNKTGNLKHNVYKLDKLVDNYFMVDASFLDKDIPISIKSFLLLLKSICIKGTNYYRCKGNKFSKIELYKKLHIHKNNFSNLFGYCLDNKLVKQIDNGFMIMDKCLWMDFTFKVDNNVKEVYRDIALLCIKHNCYFPIRSKEAHNKFVVPLLAKKPIMYNEAMGEINELSNKYIPLDFINKRVNIRNKIELLKNSCIIICLKERLTNFPIYLSWEYINKIL